MRRHFWRLRNDGRIDVHDGPRSIGKHASHFSQQNAAVRTLVACIGIRKMPANVTQASRPEQRISDGMQQHIRIRVSVQPAIKRNVHSADDELAAKYQCVNIEACAYAHAENPF